MRELTRLSCRGRQRPDARTQACAPSLVAQADRCVTAREPIGFVSQKQVLFPKHTLSLPTNRGDYTPLATRCREQTAAAVCRHLRDDLQYVVAMTALAEKLDKKLRHWQPTTAREVEPTVLLVIAVTVSLACRRTPSSGLLLLPKSVRNRLLRAHPPSL